VERCPRESASFLRKGGNGHEKQKRFLLAGKKRLEHEEPEEGEKKENQKQENKAGRTIRKENANMGSFETDVEQLEREIQKCRPKSFDELEISIGALDAHLKKLQKVFVFPDTKDEETAANLEYKVRIRSLPSFFFFFS
jgi:hypothetical protein